MVKFSINADGGKKLLGLGLSEGNIIRLKEKKPIFIKSDDLKKITGWDGYIVIMYGETEETIVEELERQGLL